jgi:hypothetical protein
LTKVKVLYLVQNKIGKIEKGELDWCKETLTSIELGGNRLRVSGWNGLLRRGGIVVRGRIADGTIDD